ncbi:MAG TPA: LD-carboxypeptidase [Williamwhitmania sp.]|nr:LD-carboxypeptidase [Williamwhitmania sp.]
MIRPPYLKTGDTIAIAAPARKITREEVAPAVALLENEGFKVVVPEGLFEAENQLAGSDEHRAAQIAELFKIAEVKAILFVRGGYGSVRTLQLIPSNLFTDNPKWIVGYSDITVFHSFLSRQGIQSLHATMPINFPKAGGHNQSTQSLVDALRGTLAPIEVSTHSGNMAGKVRGILAGGNLSVLYSLAATPIDMIPEGRILLIEDLDEYLYHIDRMMMNLKYSGKLSKISGLIVGHMSDMRDNTTPWGKSAHEIVKEAMADLSIPVAFGFPSGHLEPNLAFVVGAEVELEVTEERSTLSYLD